MIQSEEHQRPAPMPTETASVEADVTSPPRRFLLGLRTFESFRYRDYSYFFVGALLSNIGTWMQMVALGWLVYSITKSTSALGMVNFLGGVPVFFLIVFAGALADRVDRRKLLIWAQLFLMAQALAFGVLNQTGAITIPWVYGLSLAGGIVSAFMFPAWQAMVPDLVPRTSLLNAIALSSAQFNAARLVGPMVAAGVLALFGNSSGDGITAVFYVNAISFLFVIWALTVIRPAHDLNARRKEPAVKALLAGLRYARTHRRIALHLLTAAILTVFGMPFVALLPAIAADVYSLGSTGYSGLMGANGAGALVGALVVASLPHDVRRESIIRWGALVMALSLIGFSLMTLVAWAIVLLVVLGAAFLACVSSINTNLQTAVPPELRGRVMSLFVLSFMGIMPFGALAFGWLGDHIGPAQSVMVGAIALLGWALLLLARPALLCEAESDGC